MLQDLRKEQLCPILLRIMEYVIRCFTFDDQTLLKEIQPVRDSSGESHFVSHHIPKIIYNWLFR